MPPSSRSVPRLVLRALLLVALVALVVPAAGAATSSGDAKLQRALTRS